MGPWLRRAAGDYSPATNKSHQFNYMERVGGSIAGRDEMECYLSRHAYVWQYQQRYHTLVCRALNWCSPRGDDLQSTAYDTIYRSRSTQAAPPHLGYQCLLSRRRLLHTHR